jgi:hypothetical protein
VVTEEVQDAILISTDNPLDSWILDSGASFHTTAICEILHQPLFIPFPPLGGEDQDRIVALEAQIESLTRQNAELLRKRPV